MKILKFEHLYDILLKKRIFKNIFHLKIKLDLFIYFKYYNIKIIEKHKKILIWYFLKINIFLKKHAKEKLSQSK